MSTLLLEAGEKDHLCHIIVERLIAPLSASSWKKENILNKCIDLSEDISRQNFINCL